MNESSQYHSPLGVITLVCDCGGLTEVRLRDRQEVTVKEMTTERWSATETWHASETWPATEITPATKTKPTDYSNHRSISVLNETRRWLDLYFGGEIPLFTPLLHPQGTPFQQKVWHSLLSIPYGLTSTYGAIAQRIGCRSAQAVGQAIHRNPIAIIVPCHRVIGSDGSLTGYAAGLEVKRWLLSIETASCRDHHCQTTKQLRLEIPINE